MKCIDASIERTSIMAYSGGTENPAAVRCMCTSDVLKRRATVAKCAHADITIIMQVISIGNLDEGYNLIYTLVFHPKIVPP